MSTVLHPGGTWSLGGRLGFGFLLPRWGYERRRQMDARVCSSRALGVPSILRAPQHPQGGSESAAAIVVAVVSPASRALCCAVAASLSESDTPQPGLSFFSLRYVLEACWCWVVTVLS